jgi:hypothetical protein
MLFNIPVTSLALLLSLLLTVNTSPVPDHNGLALLDLVVRQDTYVFGRDIDLKRRQGGGGPGGASGGAGGGGAGVGGEQVLYVLQFYLDVDGII